MFYYLGGEIDTCAHAQSLEARKCALLNYPSVIRLIGVRGSLHHLNILPNQDSIHRIITQPTWLARLCPHMGTCKNGLIKIIVTKGSVTVCPLSICAIVLMLLIGAAWR